MSKDKFDEWTSDDWKRKLQQQAEDSREYRYKLYDKVDLKSKQKILDAGCGTGAITMDIAQLAEGEVVGVDIDTEKLEQAEKLLAEISNARVMEADITALPFEDESFDLVVFNIVLIHVKDQQKAVDEMARVTKPGGIVLGTLEPDYDGMIAYPETEYTDLWKKSVSVLGADLQTGRKLKFLFNKAGLKTEVGFDTETEFLLINDIKTQLDAFTKNFWVAEKIFVKNGWSKEKIEEFKSNQTEAIKNGLVFILSTAFWVVGIKR
ncbi:MAG: methyltransferase domain-containing protein [Thermoplasmata archaeon]|nr:MAG: methyltransferase domain-containing protein [Thermoplasmata archaeon]